MKPAGELEGVPAEGGKNYKPDNLAAPAALEERPKQPIRPLAPNEELTSAVVEPSPAQADAPASGAEAVIVRPGSVAAPAVSADANPQDSSDTRTGVAGTLAALIVGCSGILFRR